MNTAATRPVVVITQARTGSSRLPGKVLREVAGRTLLEHHLARLGQIKEADQVVVATTDKADDNAIEELCQELGISVFRGSESDVLARYHGAAAAHSAGIVVRVTSDCPLLDPGVVDGLIRHLEDHVHELDYVNNFEGSVRTYPLGFEAEVFQFGALDRAFQEATEPLDREHVTPYIWRQPEKFRLCCLPYHKNVSDLRLTVDTAEDLQLITHMLENLPTDFDLDDVLALLAKNPDWTKINSEIQHKYYS